MITYILPVFIMSSNMLLQHNLLFESHATCLAFERAVLAVRDHVMAEVTLADKGTATDVTNPGFYLCVYEVV